MPWLRRTRGDANRARRRDGGATLVVVAICLFVSLYAHAGEGIAATKDENGRTVYVNAESAESVRQQTRRASVLVYWSNAEKRWKEVPPPSPSAMRAARRAADEVASYVLSQPTAPITLRQSSTSLNAVIRRELASSDPNYGHLARGRAVSSAEIETAIAQAAARHNVDANLVRAVIKVESNFNPRAVSPKGAMGLMQLMPQTARTLNVSDPFDPRENVDAGVRHLRSLLDNYRGDVRLSLAAYNAGARAVERSSGVPHIPETQNYVKQITTMYAAPPARWDGTAMPQKRTTRVASEPIQVFRSESGRLTITNAE